MKTIGLSYVSYWGDQVEDVACGHTIFLPDLIFALKESGYEKIYAMQDDLDDGEPEFKNYRVTDRLDAYNMQEFTKELPELDMLLVEWRWKMPGRNWFENGEAPEMNDYLRQHQILSHYHNNTDTKIIIWDTDHKLTKEDEEEWHRAEIIECSFRPKHLTRTRTSVFWPVDIQDYLLRDNTVHAPLSTTDKNTYPLDPNFIVSYIGNDYDRDEQLDKYIGGLCKLLPSGTIQLYGNWLKYPSKIMGYTKRFSGAQIHPKVTKAEMEYIYSRTTMVPLLSKDSYSKHGMVAYRVLETMYNGSIPVGVTEFADIEKLVLPELVVSSAEEMYQLAITLSRQTYEQRLDLWKRQVNHFKYSAKDFVDELERL